MIVVVCLLEFAAAFALGRASCIVLPLWHGARRKESSSVPASCNLEPIYIKLCKLFDEDQIFLRPDLNAVKMTRLLLTNRVYFTAALKKYGKCNFSYFLNDRRVKWAVAYFKQHPDVNATQLGYKAGYKSPSAFNLAFKAIMNMPPGEWCRKYRINHGIPGGKEE